MSRVVWGEERERKRAALRNAVDCGALVKGSAEENGGGDWGWDEGLPVATGGVRGRCRRDVRRRRICQLCGR